MAPKGMKVDGVRIAQARAALPDAPSQAAFAARVGIHWVTQSRIETGKALVSLELLERIAEATGTTRAYLLGEDTASEEVAPEGERFRNAGADVRRTNGEARGEDRGSRSGGPDVRDVA